MPVPHRPRLNPGIVRRQVLTWLALLALLAATCASSFVALGPWNTAANLAIAVLKAALVVLVFMEIGTGTAAIRVAAIGALVMLTILAGLSATDFAPRHASQRHAAATTKVPAHPVAAASARAVAT